VIRDRVEKQDFRDRQGPQDLVVIEDLLVSLENGDQLDLLDLQVRQAPRDLVDRVVSQESGEKLDWKVPQDLLDQEDLREKEDPMDLQGNQDSQGHLGLPVLVVNEVHQDLQDQ